MKRLGIIGGIGPESTVDYYRLIIAAYREQRQDSSYPAIIINSIDLNKIRDLVTASDLAGLAEYLVAEVQRLARGAPTSACSPPIHLILSSMTFAGIRPFHC